MRTLVTGATGFVGRALARRLVDDGHVVRALVREGGDPTVLPEGVELVQGDVTDPVSLDAAVQGTDVVFHLAGIRRAATKHDFFQVNAEGTRHLCEAVAKMETPARVVFAGSLAAVGPAREGRPVHEDDPFRPFEWYGESKAEAERILAGYTGRIPWTVARPCRILGPGDQENLVFFKLVAKGLRLVVGGPRRPISMVDVVDVVEALMDMAESDAALGEAFFIAAEPPLSLAELQDIGAEALGIRLKTLYLPQPVLWTLATAADGVSRVSGHRLPLNRKLARQLTAPSWACSIEKAGRLLGWTPKVPIRESVAAAARWYRDAGLV